jgi:hypothetical protein
MDLPNEIIYEILSIADYDSLIMFSRTCYYNQELILLWHDKLFKGIHYIAWLYTKPKYLRSFNLALSEHYGLPPDKIGDIEKNLIPNIRNNIQYTATIAIEQFQAVSKMMRQLLFLPTCIIIDDLNNFNSELNYLVDIVVQLLTCVLDIVIKKYKERFQDNIQETLWTSNIKLLEDIKLNSSTERNQYIVFFMLINRLNTVICHTCKVLNSEILHKLLIIKDSNPKVDHRISE